LFCEEREISSLFEGIMILLVCGFLVLVLAVSQLGVTSVVGEEISKASVNVDTEKQLLMMNSQYVFFGRAKHNHTGTIVVGRADPNTKHQVVLSLKQDLDSLLKKLDRVSRTSHAEYGQFLKAKDASALARPASVSHVTVLDQLSLIKELVVTKISPYGDYIHVRAPVGVLEALFNTEFYVLRPSNEYTEFLEKINADVSKSSSVDEPLSQPTHAIRAFEYSLPAVLAPHVGVVFGTIQHPFAVNRASFVPGIASSTLRKQPTKLVKLDELYEEYAKASREKSAKQHSPGGATPTFEPPIIGFVYPQLLQAHYGISSIDVGQIDSDTIPNQIVFSTTNQYLSASDLTYFQKEFNLPQVEATSVNDHVLPGPCYNPEECTETNLDVEYILAMSPQTPTVLWYESDMSSSSFSLFLAGVNEMETPPGVISMSYAMLESLLTDADRYYFDVEASKLALRGVTIVAASGDSGVAGIPSSLACGYNPMFPASSPFVTAVGGTFGIEFGIAETATEGDLGEPYTAGGGFSNKYKVPWWQKSVVKEYFSQLNSEETPYEGHNSDDFIFFNKFSRDGRGYPDISAASTDYIIAVNNTNYVVSGTSAAAPVFAGMVSLANLQRAVNRKGPVGWINPVLYSSNISVAVDIPSGNNRCFSTDNCCKQGFYSTHGWDPVTGLGAVNFAHLHEVLVKLPYTIGRNTDPHSDQDFSNTEHVDTTSNARDFVTKYWWTICLMVLVVLLWIQLGVMRYKRKKGDTSTDLFWFTPTSSQSNSPLFSTMSVTTNSSASLVNSSSPFHYGTVNTSEDILFDRIGASRLSPRKSSSENNGNNNNTSIDTSSNSGKGRSLFSIRYANVNSFSKSSGSDTDADRNGNVELSSYH
jgi:tripeptidyl-peptidase-1